MRYVPNFPTLRGDITQTFPFPLAALNSPFTCEPLSLWLAGTGYICAFLLIPTEYRPPPPPSKSPVRLSPSSMDTINSRLRTTLTKTWRLSYEILPGVGHDDRPDTQIPITIICSWRFKIIQNFPSLSESPSDMIRPRKAVLLLLCTYTLKIEVQ